MDKILALLYLTLSMFGFDPGGSTFVHRSRVDEADALHTRVTVQAGVAHFECVRSITGRCHYAVHVRGCAVPHRTGSAPCDSTADRRFAIDDGDSRRITGLRRFRLCVGRTAQAATSKCVTLGSVAMR